AVDPHHRRSQPAGGRPPARPAPARAAEDPAGARDQLPRPARPGALPGSLPAAAPVGPVDHRAGAAPGLWRRNRVLAGLPALERGLAAGVAATRECGADQPADLSLAIDSESFSRNDIAGVA